MKPKSIEGIRQEIYRAKQQRLKKLDLNGYDTSKRIKLSYVPEEVFELEQLEELNLSYNELTAIPDAISRLRNLTSLNLGSNNLHTIPNSIFELQNLTSLYLYNNPLSTVPECISRLHNLTYLNVAHTHVNTLPNPLAQLKHLKLLVLGGSYLLFIPDVVYDLISLEELELVQTNHIKEISPKILQLENLKSLFLYATHIEYPPPEIINLNKYGFTDIEKIKNYFRQLAAEGTDYLYEAKLLIVGEGGAGKTTLAEKILDPDYQLREDEKSTEGIAVKQWNFQMPNGQPFRVNIWDFGGQEIYHATHQYFLTKRSLYALVADTRKEDTDFYYWLNVVELLSDNSPLLIVKNEKQNRHREINETQLRGRFENLKETLATNLADNRGLERITSEIKHLICSLPHVGTPLPKTWVKVRETLENDPRNHITLKEYLKICGDNGFTREKDMLELSEYLHDLGVCLHFQEDDLLKKIVILKPKWGTDAAYKVLDDHTVIRHQGKFDKKDLANIWREEEYAEMQSELLRLMINFKLCYRMKGSDTYIAPQWLTENQPHYEWDSNSNLILRYTYESFMPKGIVTQLIVAMHTFIAHQDYVWKSGVVLEKDQTRAEVVEAYGKREIKIRVAGKHKKELMTIVTYELDEIHRSYKRLNYNKLIPCNCATCKDSQEPHFYKFETLRRYAADKRETIECEISYERVNVLGLIDDITTPEAKDKLLEEEIKRGGVINIYGPVDNLYNQRTEKGDIMPTTREKNPPRSPWASGSFYLFTAAFILAALGVLARTVSPYVLPLILIAGILFVPLIGVLQLKNDKQLTDKSFIESLKIVIGQLPLIGKLARKG